MRRAEAQYRLRLRAHGRVPNAGNEWTPLGIATAGPAVLVYTPLALWCSAPCCGKYEPEMTANHYVPCRNCGRRPRLEQMLGKWADLTLAPLEAMLLTAEPSLDPLVALVAAAELLAALELDHAAMVSALRTLDQEPNWAVFG